MRDETQLRPFISKKDSRVVDDKESGERRAVHSFDGPCSIVYSSLCFFFGGVVWKSRYRRM